MRQDKKKIALTWLNANLFVISNKRNSFVYVTDIEWLMLRVY